MVWNTQILLALVCVSQCALAKDVPIVLPISAGEYQRYQANPAAVDERLLSEALKRSPVTTSRKEEIRLSEQGEARSDYRRSITTARLVEVRDIELLPDQLSAIAVFDDASVIAEEQVDIARRKLEDAYREYERLRGKMVDTQDADELANLDREVRQLLTEIDRLPAANSFTSAVDLGLPITWDPGVPPEERKARKAQAIELFWKQLSVRDPFVLNEPIESLLSRKKYYHIDSSNDLSGLNLTVRHKSSAKVIAILDALFGPHEQVGSNSAAASYRYVSAVGHESRARAKALCLTMRSQLHVIPFRLGTAPDLSTNSKKVSLGLLECNDINYDDIELIFRFDGALSLVGDEAVDVVLTTADRLEQERPYVSVHDAYRTKFHSMVRSYRSHYRYFAETYVAQARSLWQDKQRSRYGSDKAPTYFDRADGRDKIVPDVTKLSEKKRADYTEYPFDLYDFISVNPYFITFEELWPDDATRPKVPDYMLNW